MQTGLLVGRFQPFHLGHLATVRFAMDKVDRLIIAIGSAQKSHEPRNPFTAGERIQMIKECLDSERNFEWRRALIIPVPDIDIHSLWVNYLKLFVPEFDLVFSNDPLTIALFKEGGMKVIEPPLIRRDQLSATEVRFRISEDKNWQELVPKGCGDYIVRHGGVERIRSLGREMAVGKKRHDSVPANR